MKKGKIRLALRAETVRLLYGQDLRAARGAVINNSGTGCSCYPSDGYNTHCLTLAACPDTDQQTGCTISASG